MGRMEAHAAGTHDGSIDLLVTGCEVSLWVGEQFASDVHSAFPALRVVTLSANKLLARYGQGIPIPQTGFCFSEENFDLRGSVALLVSHSGGTFGMLNVANLLKSFTPNTFIVTSDWDTQAARAVRSDTATSKNAAIAKMDSRVFTTFCGCRPAEPCSLTVVATHQLLTQILLHLMYAARYYKPDQPKLGRSKFDIREVQELEMLNRECIENVADMSAPNLTWKDGFWEQRPSAMHQALVRQGRDWAMHVLEAPISWIICAVYFIATVAVGYTPLSAAVWVAVRTLTTVKEDAWYYGTWPAEAGSGLYGGTFNAPYWKYAVGFVDALIYLFLPWWTTVLLRLLQRRPWLHRVASRSVIIGDCPWVAQATEAFLSKCFALAYSIASVNVASANPVDHLVHRYTHRVVRGSLLAVGRPDGRLNALAAYEDTVNLSVSQASSIQNYGVTCETFTLGHNPNKLGLAKAAIFLPRASGFASQHFEKVGHSLATPRESDKEVAGKEIAEASSVMVQPDLDGEVAQDGDRKVRPALYKSIPEIGNAAYVGEWMSSDPAYSDLPPKALMESQQLVQALYEGRLASLERFVGFLVMFHAMAKRVQDFWPAVSCGLLGYDMSRSQSIMRIATTASPVAASEVRFKMLELQEEAIRHRAVSRLARSYRRHCAGKQSMWAGPRSPSKGETSGEQPFTASEDSEPLPPPEDLTVEG